jgi:antitoxin CcdA
MEIIENSPPSKRRPINLTIREDVLKEAKALNLNTSHAAELGIIAAVKHAQEQAWLKNNRDALFAHNKRIDETGTLLTPAWVHD